MKDIFLGAGITGGVALLAVLFFKTVGKKRIGDGTYYGGPNPFSTSQTSTGDPAPFGTFPFPGFRG